MPMARPPMTPADIAMAYVSPGFLEEDLATGYTLDREPTPPHVADLLDVAYEGRQVHQDGLTKLLGPRGLDIEGRGSKCLLELGSGRGRLALQAFLQYPGLRTVVAVELVSARHRAAAIATKRLRDAGGEGRFALFAALPDDDAARIGEKRLHSESVYSGEAASVRLSEGAGPEARRCDLRLGDLAALPSDDLALADAVLLEVVMPPGPGRAEAHMQLCRKLAEHCRHGCVLASYEDLHSLWRALGPDAPPCPFHKLQLCPSGYATSWSITGHCFHGFRCDRELPPSLAPGAWL
mmetsp:Transcript_163883/g.520925  ORF Transcript_163883/g.520925 Transcript_163883/m.520925 type:complete len:294 (-) Transcript_163883:14-895(-)